MRILIFCDMEGVCGIQSWEHVGGSGPLYEEGRRLYTAEVSAAVQGCLAGGAARVIAHDGHGGSYPGGRAFMNWIPDQLPDCEEAEYVRGVRWATILPHLRRQDCDAVGFVGAHARAGAENGVLSHTVSSDGWYSVTVNGREVGESEILALLAGDFGLPAVCISGDHAACVELAEAVGEGLVTVPVKQGIGRYGARIPAPSVARRMISAGFEKAVRNCSGWPAPLKTSSPVVVRVALTSPDRADAYLSYEGVRRVDARTVEVAGPTFTDAWQQLWR